MSSEPWTPELVDAIVNGKCYVCSLPATVVLETAGGSGHYLNGWCTFHAHRVPRKLHAWVAQLWAVRDGDSDRWMVWDEVCSALPRHDQEAWATLQSMPGIRFVPNDALHAPLAPALHAWRTISRGPWTWTDVFDPSSQRRDSRRVDRNLARYRRREARRARAGR